MSSGAINGRLRDDHCHGTFCNGMSVPCPNDEPSEPCECNCAPCTSAKDRGRERAEDAVNAHNFRNSFDDY